MLQTFSDSLPARRPRFRQFLAANTVSLVGSHIFDIAMPLYVLQRTGSVIDLSLVTMAIHLPHVLMAPLTGYIADHPRKRESLLRADLGQIAVLVALSAYLFSGAQALWPILLLVFALKSLMLTFETIVSFQLLPALVGRGNLTAGNTWFLSLHRLIQVVGPLLGGVLIQVAGIQACIWVNLLSFAATLRFTLGFTSLDLLLSTQARPSNPRKVRAAWGQFRESLSFIWNSPLFRPFVFVMLLWNISPLTLNSPTLTYFFTVTHQFTPAEYGLVVSSFGLIGVLGFLLSPALYRKREFASVFTGSALVQAVFGSLCLAFAGMPLVFGALFGLSRTGSSLLSMGSYFIRQTQVPRQQSGSINASLRMAFMAAVPLSSVVQGWMIDRLGIGIALAAGAASLWGAWWFSKAMGRAYRQEPPLLEESTYTASQLKRA